MYTLKLDGAAFETLHWLADRGYDCGLVDALEATDVDGVYAVPEHKAWAILEASQCPDSGFACLNWNAPVAELIRNFLDSIV